MKCYPDCYKLVHWKGDYYVCLECGMPRGTSYTDPSMIPEGEKFAREFKPFEDLMKKVLAITIDAKKSMNLLFNHATFLRDEYGMKLVKSSEIFFFLGQTGVEAKDLPNYSTLVVEYMLMYDEEPGPAVDKVIDFLYKLGKAGRKGAIAGKEIREQLLKKINEYKEEGYIYELDWRN